MSAAGDFRIHPTNGKQFALNLAIGLVILCILGPVKITLSADLPITLQSLLVVLIPIVLGWMPGVAAVVLYLMAGALGLPVFAGGASGMDVFSGDTAGFLFAFPIAALVVGYAATHTYKFETLALAGMLIGGQLLIVVGGLFWMEGVRQEALNYSSYIEALMPGLLIKSLAGMLIAQVIGRMRKRLADPVE